jgi:protein N-terminal glutamine amidohydrolase
MTKGSWHYVRLYCEENVWFLGQEPRLANFSKKAVFVSNNRRECALFHQRASPSPMLPITFDYHVFLICHNHGWQVWDLDSVLSLPTQLKEYLDKTFGRHPAITGDFTLSFRVIDFEEFRNNFSSDRSHMLDSNAKWIAPPPTWPPIVIGKSSNLADFVDMRTKSFGSVMKLHDFRREYGRGKDGGSQNSHPKR